jgi:hypothetical protein
MLADSLYCKTPTSRRAAMRIAVFDTKNYDRQSLDGANQQLTSTELFRTTTQP